MSQVYAVDATREQAKERCARGSLRIHTAMKLLIVLGVLVTAAAGVLLYMKFLKAMFVLIIPLSVPVSAAIAMATQRRRLVLPLVAISCFHMVLCAYVFIIFAFYFIFKPNYIIMVLNWAFKTMHAHKTTSFYVQCGCIAVGLVAVFALSLWQALVAHAYYRYLVRKQRAPAVDVNRQSSPTVLIVNNNTKTDYAPY